MTGRGTTFFVRMIYRGFSFSQQKRILLADHLTRMADLLWARPVVLIGMSGFAGGSLAYYFSNVWIWIALLLLHGFLFVWQLLRIQEDSLQWTRLMIICISLLLGLFCMSSITLQRNRSFATLQEVSTAGSTKSGLNNINEDNALSTGFADSAYGAFDGYIVSISIPDDRYKSYTLLLENGVRICFGSARADLTYGRHVRITGSLERVPKARNPGGFDQRGYFERQGIFLQIVTFDNCISILQDRSMQPGLYERLQWTGLMLRSRISALWGEVLHQEDASLLSGMILGDTSGMSTELKTAFRMCSLSHLTAVSGANVSFFLLPMTALFRKMSGRRTVRFILIFCFLIFFGFLTGWTASVTRALFMSMGIIVSALLMKRHDAVSAMFLTAVILLINNPFTAVDYGFLLSFCATLSLVQFMDRMASILHFLPGGNAFRQAVSCVFCTQIGMLPWLAALSGRQSPLLFVINVAGSFLAEGISLISLPLSAALGLIHFLPALLPVLRILYLPLAGLLYVLKQMAYFGANQSIQALRLQTVHPFLLLAILLFGITLLLQKSFFSRNARRLMSVILCISIGFQCWSYLHRPIATVIFADVGQGDCELILLNNNKSILIDGGDQGSGTKILIPLLNYYGIEEPDITILTHLHRDHGSGIIELIQAGRISNVFTPCLEKNLELSELFKLSNEKRVALHSLRKDDKMVLSDSAVLYVLSPETIEEDGGNEDSAVVLLVVDNTGILFMGDAGIGTEEKIMADIDTRNLLESDTDILKVGHHGSKFATSTMFLSAMHVKAAVICVGKNNYGHPTRETIDRITGEGIDLFRTDRFGAVMIDIQTSTFQVHTYGS